MTARIKGTFTFQTAGILFILSALIEIFSVTSRVPLLGALRGGVVAAVYHLTYVGLFLLLGFGLFRARPWAYQLVFIVTGIYTFDRLIFVLDRKALEIYLQQQLAAYSEIFQWIDMRLLVDVITVATLLGVLCWLGFAWYAIRRRAYFFQVEPRRDSRGDEGDHHLHM